MVTATNKLMYNVGLVKDPQMREEYKLNLANKCLVLQERHEKEPVLKSQWQNATDINLSRSNWAEEAAT